MMDLLKRLGLNKYTVDPKPHIEVDENKCIKCKEKFCVRVCPAGTYEPLQDGRIAVHYERCLECGAALVACPYNAIKFRFPENGISYKYG